ncbi:MAG TPA: ABC transporter substrate-binding protein [Chloroflexota bacterium]|nr:ABC transporter substrate-binding protein [Chloroflexota bacterium]HZU06925.1 ABC transporter substrate-binding protein [Chloroflexota bacterium]
MDRHLRSPAGVGAFGLLALAVGLVLACSPAASGANPAPQQVAGPAAEAPAPAAPPAPVRLRVAYSQVYPGQTVLWTTQEAGLFARHGLDVELSYIASSQTVAAVLAREVDIALGGGYAVINARLSGSDLVMFFGLVTWFPYELMVAPEIESVQDLRGKALGVSRFGSSSDVATRLALQQFGLVPERDVIIVQTGSLQERIAAMRAGAVVGGMASPPDPTILRRLGFKSILDLGSSGEQELNNIAFASAAWLRENEAAAQAFVDALLEGIHFAKTNREFTERVLAQYLKLDDAEALADSYDHFVGQHLERVPDPGREGARKYLQSQAATDPRAAQARVEDFFDLRFLERAVASGLIDRLYGSE